MAETTSIRGSGWPTDRPVKLRVEYKPHNPRNIIRTTPGTCLRTTPGTFLPDKHSCRLYMRTQPEYVQHCSAWSKLGQTKCMVTIVNSAIYFTDSGFFLLKFLIGGNNISWIIWSCIIMMIFVVELSYGKPFQHIEQTSQCWCISIIASVPYILGCMVI